METAGRKPEADGGKAEAADIGQPALRPEASLNSRLLQNSANRKISARGGCSRPRAGNVDAKAMDQMRPGCTVTRSSHSATTKFETITFYSFYL